MGVRVQPALPDMVVECEHTQLAMEEEIARTSTSGAKARDEEPGGVGAWCSTRSRCGFRARPEGLADGHHPFGSLEEHGPHLPLGTDIVCRWSRSAAARRSGRAAHLAPAIPYGVCRSTRNHPGTVGISTATLRALVVDLVRDIHRHGMRAAVLISGHAGKTHLCTLVDAGEQLIEELPDLRVSVISE